MISYFARTRPTGQTFFHLLLALALVGCARTVVQHPAASQGSPGPAPIRLKLALHMDDDFRQYTYEERNFQIPVGELLFQKVPATLRTVFSEVQVLPDPAHLDPGGGAYQAILRPRVRFVTYHPFFRERRTLLEAEGRVRIYSEWTLADPAGGNIWSQEIVGQAEGDARTRARLDGAVEAAMADLLKKLQSALMTSSRVADYAGNAGRR